LIGTGSQAEGDEGRLPEESGVFGRVRLPVLCRPDHLLAGVDTDGFFSGGPGRARTCDLRIMSLNLGYRMSRANRWKHSR